MPEKYESSTAYACDWWLPSRRQCRRGGSKVTTDTYGATLRFCPQHRRLAHLQYAVPHA